MRDSQLAKMLTNYINAALRHAHDEILTDDRSYYGDIPNSQGVYANADTLEDCRERIKGQRDWSRPVSLIKQPAGTNPSDKQEGFMKCSRRRARRFYG